MRTQRLEYENRNRVISDSENYIISQMRAYMAGLRLDYEIRKLRDENRSASGDDAVQNSVLDSSINAIIMKSRMCVPEVYPVLKRQPKWKIFLKKILGLSAYSEHRMRFPDDTIRLNNMSGKEKFKRWLNKKIDKI